MYDVTTKTILLAVLLTFFDEFPLIKKIIFHKNISQHNFFSTLIIIRNVS